MDTSWASGGAYESARRCSGKRAAVSAAGSTAAPARSGRGGRYVVASRRTRGRRARAGGAAVLCALASALLRLCNRKAALSYCGSGRGQGPGAGRTTS